MTAARDRAAQMRARREAAAAVEPTPTTPAPVVKRDPVRLTVDLLPDRFDEWGQGLLQMAMGLGWSRVSAQDALAAMVDVVLDDEQMARRVRARLEEIGPRYVRRHADDSGG